MSADRRRRDPRQRDGVVRPRRSRAPPPCHAPMEPIEYTFTDTDGDFDLEAWSGGRRIGYVWGIRTGARLHLAEITVLDDPPGFRGRGIGRELLSRVLAKADAGGIEEVWGSVTGADLEQCPTLLSWYARYGFVSEPPDRECLSTATVRIVRRRR